MEKKKKPIADASLNKDSDPRIPRFDNRRISELTPLERYELLKSKTEALRPCETLISADGRIAHDLSQYEITQDGRYAGSKNTATRADLFRADLAQYLRTRPNDNANDIVMDVCNTAEDSHAVKWKHGEKWNAKNKRGDLSRQRMYCGPLA